MSNSNTELKKSWILKCINSPNCKNVNNSQIYKLNYGVNNIGRARINDIIVENETVSKYHCQLRVENDQLTIRDVGSKNGTIVQGLLLEGLEDYILDDYDIIYLSNYECGVSFQILCINKEI